MNLDRRHLLASALLLPAVTMPLTRARAAESKTLRVGFQYLNAGVLASKNLG